VDERGQIENLQPEEETWQARRGPKAQCPGRENQITGHAVGLTVFNAALCECCQLLASPCLWHPHSAIDFGDAEMPAEMKKINRTNGP